MDKGFFPFDAYTHHEHYSQPQGDKDVPLEPGLVAMSGCHLRPGRRSCCSRGGPSCGLIALAVIYGMGRNGRFGKGNYLGVEGSVKYWHFLDVAWVFIYPVLYLVN